jgi:phage baseplate assembly protein W
MPNPLLGKDLKLIDGLYGTDLAVRNGDLDLVEGIDNLVQALVLRLNSNRGILRRLGHPAYGTRLTEAIGIIQTAANLRQVENLVREAILQEPRVQSIESLFITSRTDIPGAIEVEVALHSITDPKALNLVITLQP